MKDNTEDKIDDTVSCLSEIKQFNTTEKMCNEKTCDKDAVNCLTIKVKGITFYVILCEDHSKMFENNSFYELTGRCGFCNEDVENSMYHSHMFGHKLKGDVKAI